MTGNLPEWMSPKKARQKQNTRSAKQEQKRAEEINGRTQAGSGSSRRAPQDVRGSASGEERLEQLKYTDADGLRITAAELLHTYDDALRAGCSAGFVIEFPRHGVRLVGTVERVQRPSSRKRG